MDDDIKEEDQSFNSADDNKLLKQRSSESRGVKKAPEQKNKDKVWESIMN
mgnify:CR=1 FL=1